MNDYLQSTKKFNGRLLVLRNEFPHTKNLVFDRRYILREHGNLIVMRIFTLGRNWRMQHGNLVVMYSDPDGSQILNRRMTMLFEIIVASHISNNFLYKRKRFSSDPQKGLIFFHNPSKILSQKILHERIEQALPQKTTAFRRNSSEMLSTYLTQRGLNTRLAAAVAASSWRHFLLCPITASFTFFILKAVALKTKMEF